MLNLLRPTARRITARLPEFSLPALRKPKRDGPLPYGMFDLAKEAYQAKQADILEGVYHRAQERAWSGKEILPMLIEKHGKPDLPDDKKEALARIFAIILWGELAAWKISAQLAESIVPLEAKMAATSQSFDEARHFYSMYDYLSELGYVPENIDRLSEKVLDFTLGADNLAHKICGMQLMIETIALTIFQTVRKQRVEPVLAELLRYFELDEARHVALGVNYLPSMIRQMSKIEIGRMALFQLKLMVYVIASLRELRPDLKTLGIDARAVIELGKAKQFEVFREMWSELGVDMKDERFLLARVVDAADELFFPDDEERTRISRARRAVGAFISSRNAIDDGLVDEAKEQMTGPAAILKGMGSRFRWKGRRRRAREAQTSG